MGNENLYDRPRTVFCPGFYPVTKENHLYLEHIEETTRKLFLNQHESENIKTQNTQGKTRLRSAEGRTKN